jgi:hypothetical protein
MRLSLNSSASPMCSENVLGVLQGMANSASHMCGSVASEYCAQILCTRTGFPCKVLSLSTRPEVAWLQGMASSAPLSTFVAVLVTFAYHTITHMIPPAHLLTCTGDITQALPTSHLRDLSSHLGDCHHTHITPGIPVITPTSHLGYLSSHPYHTWDILSPEHFSS